MSKIPKMALGFLLPLRIAEGVCSALVLSLAAYVHHCNHSPNHTGTNFNSENNFLIFAPIFALLSIAYVEGLPRMKSEVPQAHLVVEFLNAVFYMSGFIALAKRLSDANACSGSACGASRAEVVFASFSWVLWSCTLLIAVIELFRRGISWCCGSRKKQQEQIAMKEAQINNAV